MRELPDITCQTIGHCIQRPAWNKEGGLYSCGFNLIFW